MIARRFQTLLTRTHGLRRVGLTCWSAALISGSWGMAPSISFAQQPPPVEVPTPAPAPVPLPEDPPLPTPIVPIPEVPPIPEAATLPATAATSAPARVAVRPAQDGQAEPGNLPQALPNAAAENTPPLPEEVADPKMSAKELENLTPYTNIPNPRPITGQIAELFELIQDPSVELSVVVGRGKVIQLREQPLRFILGNPRIATLSFPPSDVQSLAQLDRPSDARLFVVYGIQAGTTTLTIWDKNNVPTTFLVRVSVDTLDIQNQIRAVFPGTDVTVRQSANQIILEGQVPDTKTMNEVIRLVNGLLVSNQAGEVRAPTGAGGGGAGGQSVGAFAAAERALGDEAPSAISPQIINRLRVPGPRQILLKVKLAELNRTAIREIGANWLRGRNNSLIGSQIGGIAGFTTETNTQMTAAFAAPSFGRPGIAGGQPIPGSVTGSLIQGIDTLLNATAGSALQPSAQLFGIFRAGEFDLFLNALRTNNLATILAEPNLTALDGQPARVIAGGEIPFPVPQLGAGGGGGGAVITIQFRPFGAILTFLPQILEDDLIRLDVEPVFSTPNQGLGTSINGTAVPGFNTRSARTVVQLREGETLAIAGLIQKNNQAATNRIPLLGDAPIVGPLFSRNRFETLETELIVIVTPYLVAPMGEGEVPKVPTDYVDEPNDIEFFILGRTEGKTGIPHRSTIQHHTPFTLQKHFASENQWVVGPHGHSSD